MVDPNAEVLVMPTPTPEQDIRIRLCSYVEYAQTCSRLIVATADPAHSLVKQVRNELGALRNHCRGYCETPEQANTIRIATLELRGLVETLYAADRVSGTWYIARVTTSLDKLLNAIGPKTAPAKAQKAT